MNISKMVKVSFFPPHEKTSHNLGAIFARTVWQSMVTFRQTVIVERLNVRHTYRHSRQPWASAGGTVECREKDQRDRRSPRIPTVRFQKKEGRLRWMTWAGIMMGYFDLHIKGKNWCQVSNECNFESHEIIGCGTRAALCYDCRNYNWKELKL